MKELYKCGALSSEQLQALFESITAQQSQGDSSSYLPQLRSDQEGETPLDTQLEAEGETGNKGNANTEMQIF